MKSYEEITCNLLKRRDNYLVNKKKKEKALIGTLSSFCVVCLVMLLGFGVWNNGTFVATTFEYAENKGEDSIETKNLESDFSVEYNKRFESYNKTESINSTESGTEPESEAQSGIIGDTIGMVIINDTVYTQFDTFSDFDELSKSYTLDNFLGDASKYEGTYKESINDIWAMLYTVKEDSDVLIVVLENGAYVSLKQE